MIPLATYVDRFGSVEFERIDCVNGETRFFVLIDRPHCYQTAKEDWGCLKTVGGKKLAFLGANELADALEYFLWEVIQKEDEILFVFPGNGANYPRAFSGVCGHIGQICNCVGQVSVFAKRLWTPGSDPVAMAGQITPEIFLNLGVKTVVVVDDVISSGKTMGKLYQNNNWRFPRAKWIGVSWISQQFSKSLASNLRGYSRIVTACMIWGNGKKAPINSLSTLLDQPDIAKSFAERYFVNPKDFLLSTLFMDDAGILVH